MLIQQFYFVYFLTNKNNNVLYIGVTNNLERRVWEHNLKHKPKSFTSKYICNKLVYFETFEGIKNAIAREKQLKNWKREWKDVLIEKENKYWNDLASDWFTEEALKYKNDADAESSSA